MHYCGIDVGKHKHVATIIDEAGEVVGKATTITNSRVGFDQLSEMLAPYASQIHIGLESTGHYWLTLYEHLSQEGHAISVINPLQVRAFRRIDIRKRKTDRWDSFWIADFVRHANPRCVESNMPEKLQLRELTRFRYRLTEQIGDCKRKILCILDRVFPEYQRIFSNVFLVSSQELLRNAVTAQDFAEFDLDELAAILHRKSRGRFGPAKAEELHNAATQSVGVSFLVDAVRIEMSCLLGQIDVLHEQRCLVDQHIEKLMAEMPQYIMTIPGVGPTTGAVIVAEIGDVERFEAIEQLVAYAGIDPSVVQTGQFEGDKAHMSKRGSPYLRHALWQASVASLLHNPELKAFYDKKIAEGKPYGVAVGAVCRKLLARIYIILKEQRPYVIR